MKINRLFAIPLVAALAGPALAQGPEFSKSEKLGPDSEVHEGVPKGKLEGPFLFRSKALPNTVRKYWVHVPAQYKPEKPACVLVFQDGARAINPKGARVSVFCVVDGWGISSWRTPRTPPIDRRRP